MILLQSIFVFLFFNTSQAQVMSTFMREQVGSLPQGRFMISMVSVQSSFDQMFNRQGVKESLSQNFKQNISFQKISNEEPIRGNQLAGLFLSNNIALSDSAGDVSGSVNGTISGKIPVIGYGISDDLGIFFALPVIEFNLNASYQFQKSPVTQGFLNQLRDSDQQSVAQDFEVALHTSLENKLYKSNYDWNSSLHKTYLGDLQINLLKALEKKSDFKSQVQPYFIIPTSNDQDLRDLYGLHAGDHRFGLGVKYSAQHQFFGSLQFNAGVSATFLFPSEQGRRLPKDSNDQLNEYLDSHVWVTGGMSYRSQVQIRYPFPKWLGLNLGVDWQQRFQDSFSGSAFNLENYQMAESKTGSSLLSSYASIDLNSIQSFLSGGFIFPAIAELGVGIPLLGKNAISEPVIQLQGSMFF